MTAAFKPQATYAAGANPDSVAVADINGDGKPDIVVTGYDSQSASVLLNDGFGGFGAPVAYALGANAASLVAVDVNGDGRPDLVTADGYANAVSVLLNDGHGGFGPATRYAAGANADSVAVADVNGDGRPDLLVANANANTVSVLLNTGNGGFGPQTTYATGSTPFSGAGSSPAFVTTADVNGDGRPDMIVANLRGNAVSVLLNDGHGGFGAPSFHTTGSDPAFVAAVDVNGDGKPDLVVANSLGFTVSVLLNDGSGGFGPQAQFATIPDPVSISVADVNGDGKPDLVVGSTFGAAVSVLLNDGNGAFSAQPALPTGAIPRSVATADVNGDGQPDIIAANFGGSSVSVLLNGSGSIVRAHGPHADYTVAVDPATGLLLTDNVAGRDGSQAAPGAREILFADGIGRVDLTGNAEEVARLYQAALGRAADLPGLNAWSNQIDAGTVGLQGAASSFIASTEFASRYGGVAHEGLVRQLYQNVLGRPGDSGGVAFWTNLLDNGASAGQVLVGFSDSAENKDLTRATIGDKDAAEAYRMYQAALNRTPDRGGLDFWTGALDHGATPLAVANGFSQTAEFAANYGGLGNGAFVDRLYQNVLHRAGDPSGRAFWTDGLAGGASQAQVLAGFSDSAENRAGTASATHDGWVFLG